MRLLIKLCSLTPILMFGITLAATERPPYYFRIDGGGMIQNDVELKSSSGGEIDMDPGVRFDFAGGYQFQNSLALELEVGVLYNNIDRITNPDLRLSPNPATRDINFYQIPILLNGVYSLPLHSKIKPYAGVGAGGLISILEGWEEGWLLDYRVKETDFTFAYQGMAGIDFVLNDQIKLGVTYKFLGSLDHNFDAIQTKETYSHSFLAAFTFSY